MKKILLLALFLYNIVTVVRRAHGYDYDDLEVLKRHSGGLGEERRNWRKKALQKPFEYEHKDWSDSSRRRHDLARLLDELDLKNYDGLERLKELEYKRRYEEMEKFKSAEAGLPSLLDVKDAEKKSLNNLMNCDRQHERYEACFAGCASVSCDNPRDRLRPCFPFCEPGCVCAHPYVRDDRTHKCVLPEECTRGLKGIPDLGGDT